MNQNSRHKAPLLLVVSLIAATFVASAQNASPGPANVIKGSEHPEGFPHRIAFAIFLNLLEIDPRDAPRKQRIARAIELHDMGLSTDDASALGSAVESYRVHDSYIQQQVSVLSTVGGDHSSEFAALQKQHEELINNTAAEVVSRLSPEGRMAVRRFLDRIISKAQISDGADSPPN